MSELSNALLIEKIILSFQQGEKNESFEKLKKYLDKYPNDNIARYNFAYICKELNYKNLAIKNYNVVNKNNPKNWKSRFNLYLIYVIQKKTYHGML